MLHEEMRVALVQPRERCGKRWLNAIGSKRLRWLPAELIGDERRARCSLALAKGFRLRVIEARGAAMS